MNNMNTLEIDVNASVDEKYKNRYWSVNIKGTSNRYKINENGKLMSYSLSCNDTVESLQDLSGNYLRQEWVHMTNFTGVVDAKDKNNKATFIISNGILQNIKDN